MVNSCAINNIDETETREESGLFKTRRIRVRKRKFVERCEAVGMSVTSYRGGYCGIGGCSMGMLFFLIDKEPVEM